MKKILITVLLLIGVLFNLKAQNFTESWEGIFSYLDVSSMSQSETEVYAAAQNAVFVYNKDTKAIKTITTLNGLSGDVISTIQFDENRRLLLIGYISGLIQIYNENDNSVFSVVDILEKPTLTSDLKKINHLNISGNIVYISTEFGVSEYDIDAFEFGDTYFLGVGNQPLKITQSAIFDGFIYAASISGIRRGLLSNPNLIDSNEWETIGAGLWDGIEVSGGKLFGASVNRRVYEIQGKSIFQRAIFPERIISIEGYGNLLNITTNKRSSTFNVSTFTELVTSLTTEYFSNDFTVGLPFNNTIYIGTTRSLSNHVRGAGMLKIEAGTGKEIHPECPLSNRIFKVKAINKDLFITHTGHDEVLNPFIGNLRLGFSQYIKNGWLNKEYNDISSQLGGNKPFSLSYISINPKDNDNVFVSSSLSGVLEFNDGDLITRYDESNSTIVPFVDVYHFVYSSIFDNDGNFWVMNGRVDNPLNKFTNGNWSSVNFADAITPPNSNLGFTDMTFDDLGNLFIATSNYGVVSYNFNSSKPLTVLKNTENNMPSNFVWAIEKDLNNQIWVGTNEGLRVINNPAEFADGNPSVENIIILDNGEASELLFSQFVSNIEVDGNNNKWIGTIFNGVYYLSEDGQKTIYHFTKDNSPLPTNDILDISIDESTGKVYFATDKGMVVFKADARPAKETLEDSYVYPNPVRPNYNITSEKVKITGLTEKVNIKITDIEGNLVAEAQDGVNGAFEGFNLEINGGVALWNGKNLANNIVATGVYPVFITDLETKETKVLKIMVVR